jgi:hypothetical protein
MIIRYICSLTAGTALLGITGCVNTPIDPNAERGPQGTILYEVKVEASDPGTKIEANGDYIGEAPCVLKIFGDPDGTFHNFGRYDYTIRAFPSKSDQHEKVKVFRTGGWFTPEDQIPKRIYFDMK